MKKILLAGTSLVVVSWTNPAFTNDADKVVNSAGNVFVDTVDKQGFFQWVEGQFNYKNRKLEYGLTGFKVLSENKSTVNYLQTTLSRKGSSNTLNLGVGTRNLTKFDNRDAIVGFNAFVDSKDGTKRLHTFDSTTVFQRLSFGLELKTGAFDVSVNYYSPMGNSTILNQKVMQGYDLTAMGAIPNMDALTIGLSAYKFKGVTDTINQGNKLIAEFKPNSVLTLRAEYDKPRTGKANTNIYTGIKLAFGTSFKQQLARPKVGGDAWAKRYDKVERNYEIITESMVSSDAFSMSSSLDVGFSSGSDSSVTATQVTAKLNVAGDQTKKADWSLKSLAKKDSAIGNDTLEIGADNKTMTIKKAIAAGTTILATFEHNTYNDVTVELTVKTVGGGASMGSNSSGLSQKRGLAKDVGEGAGKMNYDLITSRTLNDVTETWSTATTGDFVFEIIANGSKPADAGSLEETTSGIEGSGNLASLIDVNTGALKAGTAKAGKLLVSVKRKEKTKNGVKFPEATSYVNIDITD